MSHAPGILFGFSPWLPGNSQVGLAHYKRGVCSLLSLSSLALLLSSLTLLLFSLSLDPLFLPLSTWPWPPLLLYLLSLSFSTIKLPKMLYCVLLSGPAMLGRPDRSSIQELLLISHLGLPVFPAKVATNPSHPPTKPGTLSSLWDPAGAHPCPFPSGPGPDPTVSAVSKTVNLSPSSSALPAPQMTPRTALSHP